MNDTTRPDPVDDVLRSLDAAPATLTPEQSARAEALLATLTVPEVTPLAPRRRARWLVPAAAAATLAVGALVWPWNPSTPSAYADWTAEATPASPEVADRVAASCRDARHLGDDARIQVAEQRGIHVFVALRSRTQTAECLAPADTARVGGGTGGSGPDASTVGPRDAEVNGAALQGGRDGSYAFTRGRVGAEVTAVTIHAGDRTIEATLGNGEYIAWWPVGAEVVREPAGVDISVDVTYRDGTTSTDHQSRPGMGRPGPGELGRVAEGRGVEGGKHVGFVEGLAGRDVVGVTVHADGIVTVAELRDGTFSARWELPAGVRADGTAPEVRYSVTLEDGTVLDDVVPLNR